MNTTRLVGAALNAAAVPAPRLTGRLLCGLWSHAGRPRSVTPADLDLHERARVHTLRVRGWDVAAYSWGDGALPVLLVHGWRSRASRFAPLVRRLLDLGYSPVSWDAPGHGATPGPVGTVLDAREIMGLLQARHGRFAAVVAHSLGAPFAVHALREGVEADRAVLVAGVSDFAFTVHAFATALGLGPRAVAALRRTVEGHHFGGDPTVWTRFSVGEGAALAQPLLLLHDEHDTVVPAAQSHLTLAAHHGRARLITTSGLGHSALLRDPAVLDAVTGFVRGAGEPVRGGGDVPGAVGA
ncbi:alpha/beta fold hydrolase [Nocardiopsis sp. RV163]|uniref:alpha/beta fold hydrolase n=1 Tax=Nocardiopsis sp. RV163 TaxID=1661388 RepID=UPI00064B88C0|nr:alpha/beta fold hydrolase [Nocardiopsis sp. RV163]